MTLQQEGTLGVAGEQRPFAVRGDGSWHCLHCDTITEATAEAFGSHACSAEPAVITGEGTQRRAVGQPRRGTTRSGGDAGNNGNEGGEA
jgi:hypothetical protein